MQTFILSDCDKKLELLSKFWKQGS